MKLIEVSNAQTAREFIDLPRTLYKGDPNWICPLDNEVMSVFDDRRNAFFSHGVCTRWLLEDEKGKIIGRIAAFINYEKASKKKASKIFEKLSKDYRRCGSDLLLLFLRLYIPR